MGFSDRMTSALISTFVLLAACGGSQTASDNSSISESEAEELYDWCLANRGQPTGNCGKIVDWTVDDVNDGYADRKCAIRFMKEFVTFDPQAYPNQDSIDQALENIDGLRRKCFSPESKMMRVPS